MSKAPFTPTNSKWIKSELTTNSSQKDDLIGNKPITLLNLFYFFQCEWGLSATSVVHNVYEEYVIELHIR